MLTLTDFANLDIRFKMLSLLFQKVSVDSCGTKDKNMIFGCIESFVLFELLCLNCMKSQLFLGSIYERIHRFTFNYITE